MGPDAVVTGAGGAAQQPVQQASGLNTTPDNHGGSAVNEVLFKLLLLLNYSDWRASDCGEAIF